ncbi:ferredoxin reductase family protein [Pseudonocardia thermophila]|jgi:Predicted ferric reductase|uniref:ferredoxin reductase family protein n=1 Tax=Pseudonocardia thermophila TaxID=1848 RepID=UPI00248E753D|nr:ferric reductase-like transmembrane domain-containing protein [Pseudonocardia thermophila]
MSSPPLGASADPQAQQDQWVRVAWLAALGVVIAGPALLWLAVSPPAPLWTRLSDVTGFFALTALVCAVIVPSRIRSLNRAFGIESVIEVHRFLGISTAVLTLVHIAFVVALDPANLGLFHLPTAPDRAIAATLSTLSLLALTGAAALRKRLRIPYDVWRFTHIGLAGFATITGALHVWWLDHSIRNIAMFCVFALLLVAVAGVVLYRWVWRSLLDPTTEFLVREVRPESPTVSTLVLQPRHPGIGGGWEFAPGQFAWIRLRRSITAEEHPFTIASSAHDGSTEFTIRHAGDFTSAIRALPPGSPVWVDGPHGAFTSDIGACSGFVLIAGGVGITPMMSMLRTAADRGDRRPYRLIVVASSPEDLLFREELGFLRTTLDLEVTEVLRRPREGWDGPIGGLSVGLFAMVLRTVDRPDDLDYFICGPPGLVNDALDVLDALDVAPARVHTELFDFV